jgi:LPXTG-motif cell wall-anchored protein
MNVITQGEIYSNAGGNFWKNAVLFTPAGPIIAAARAAKGESIIKRKDGSMAIVDKSGSVVQEIPKDAEKQAKEKAPETKAPDTKAPDTSATPPPPSTGMSSGAKIGLAIGGVVVIGLVIFLATRKK